MTTRPTCANCGKPLREVTLHHTFTPAELGNRPRLDREEAYEVARQHGHKVTKLSVWPNPDEPERCYIGYNYLSGTFGRNGRGVFCTDTCAIGFAYAAHKAGYRRKGD